MTATITVPKVTLKDMANIDLFGGVVQSATADAVVDCLIEGIIPKDLANELCIVSLVWIDPRCAKHATKPRPTWMPPAKNSRKFSPSART